MTNAETNKLRETIQSILVVDDEPSLRTMLVRSLEKAGYVCQQAADAETAIHMMVDESVDLVISDIQMPGIDGIKLMSLVKKNHPELDFIIMTGYATEYSYVDIMNAGASDYITKPFDINSLLARIHRIAREKSHLFQLKKSNQELCIAIDRANRLAQEAEDASNAKTFFLASMSHEIRTPLNGIVGYTDMLSDTPLNEEQELFVRQTRFSCETLLSVVNDILDFSKVEAGKLNLEQISFDPEVLVFDLIDMVRPKVDESRVELICTVSDNVPGLLKGDPHRFRQVMLNLLSNAVKFTHEGVIKVSIGSELIDQQYAFLTICVTDSGIGIAADKLQSIFEPFIQSEDDITQRYGGTGLGLAICKKIAKKMGGDVWADQNDTQGSTFTFTSTLEIIHSQNARRVRPAELKGKKVLLACASEETGKILSHEFSMAGMIVETINVSDAFARHQNLETDVFDIGVIDFGKIVKKPDSILTGYLAEFQKMSFSSGCIATSVPCAGIAETFREAGFKGYLPTPISRSKLFEMLAYVIGVYEADPEKTRQLSPAIVTAHTLSENKKHGVSILLVEDNPVNQKMTQLMLTKAGYLIDIAVNGEEGVEKYTRTPSAYDIIFMDINMPVMNGFDATEKIRIFEAENRLDRRIPILALTANVLEDFRHKCESVGMDDFLTKPIKRDLVFKAIQQWTAN